MARPSDLVKGSKLVVFASVCIVLAGLYFAREVMIPLALAVLFCFLLAPLTTRLQRWGLARVPAVMSVVLSAFLVAASLAWIVAVQVANLVDRMPDYQDEIARKIHRVRGQGGTLEKMAKVAETIERATTQPAATTQSTTQPATTQSTAGEGEGGGAVGEAVQDVAASAVGAIVREAADVLPAAPAAPATQPGADPDHPVYVVNAERVSPLTTLGGYAGLVLAPLGTAGLVVVFVIFMLIQREDLRDRMIRLVGQGQLHVTTQAVNDAALRVSRYMIAQAIVNGSYGLIIMLGLWAIGHFAGGKPFPTFVLWGLLCAVLRFIPYIGPWIAAAFPIMLSLAVYDGFTAFAWTAGMFVVVELFSNNVMEPWLYGSSTGMSAVAVLVAAVFWTWLWGPVGLLLSTPLTVVLVVLGKYVPQLKFLDILLGDEAVLEPSERVYQRLLAGDQEEAVDVGHELLKTQSLEQLYDDVLTPALAMAEIDRHKGRLDDERISFIRQAMRDMVEEYAEASKAMEQRVETDRLKRQAAETVKSAKTGTLPANEALTTSPVAGGNGNAAAAAAPVLDYASPAGTFGGEAAAVPRARIPKDCAVRVLCLPAHDEADEIVGAMLCNLLDLRGYCATNLSVTKLASEMVEAVEAKNADLVCISALPPAAVTYSRYLCKRLHARYPDISMVVGLWAARGDQKKARERITCEESVTVVTTLTQALEQIQQSAQPLLVKPAADQQAAVK